MVPDRGAHVPDGGLPLEVEKRQGCGEQQGVALAPPQQCGKRPGDERTEPGRIAPHRSREQVGRDASEPVQGGPGAQRPLILGDREQRNKRDHGERPQRGERERLAPALGEGDRQDRDRNQGADDDNEACEHGANAAQRRIAADRVRRARQRREQCGDRAG